MIIPIWSMSSKNHFLIQDTHNKSGHYSRYMETLIKPYKHKTKGVGRKFTTLRNRTLKQT